jgi:DNA-binding CsgD family transcriptional regulator
MEGATRFVARTPEARARADEIVQAFEEWWSGAIVSMKRIAVRGLPAAELRMAAAGRLGRDLHDKVIKTPALTLDGRIAKARCLAVNLIDGESASAFPGSELLTRREHEVLALIAGSATNKEAAQQLGISQRTVETHRAHIMRKLAAKNSVDLARKVMRQER